MSVAMEAHMPTEPSEVQVAFRGEECSRGQVAMTGDILIVDDDPSVLKSVARLLTAYGYSTVVAANGSQALQRALEQSPDVILMDVHMPAMNGVDAARAIKSHPQLQRTAIIAITALPSDRELEEPSFDCVLKKPCPASDLIAAIEKVRR